MKNLAVSYYTRTNFGCTIVGQCIDADNEKFYVLTEDFRILESGKHGSHTEIVEHRFDVESFGIKKLANEDVVLMEFIVEIGSVLVVLKSGHFIHVGVATYSQPSDCRYIHKKPISSIKISPDQDLLAMADIDNDLFIVALDDYSNVLHSANALTFNDSLHKPVGVGWGSKETQFFGLDGRPAKEKEHKDKVNILSEDELKKVEEIECTENFKDFTQRHAKNTTLDWRGDGQLIATLTFIPDTKKHYLKVWNRNLELQYMGEQLVTMEDGLLSWIPNGQYICCCQRRDNCVNEIAMFEKNGMVHQRITLPVKLANSYINEMLWSPNSKILAISLVQFELHDSRFIRRPVIMLYTMQNFHYYLKYTSYLDENNDYHLKWDPINHNKLYITSSNGQFDEFDCLPTVNYCHDNSTVFVVDADKLLITPFSISNIPPPMSAIEINFDSLIRRVFVNPLSIKTLYVSTIDNRLYHFTTDVTPESGDKIITRLDNKFIREFKLRLGQLASFLVNDLHNYQNLVPLEHGLLLVTKQVNNSSSIYLLQAKEECFDSDKVHDIKQKRITHIVRNPSKLEKVYYFLDDMSCNEIDLRSSKSSQKFTLEATTERSQIVDSCCVEKPNGETIVISLTQDLTLRTNDQILASNCCNSFRSTKNFIIYTTTDSSMYFISIKALSAGQTSDSYCQPIENGGCLILASEEDSKVILQMPRGNLEILQPRILVLYTIAKLLDDKKYAPAMKLAKRHRVDLNFLCDYLISRQGEEFFGETLDQFVDDIIASDPSLLNLFITELNDDNTILGRYSNIVKCLPLPELELEHNESFDEKVNQICSSIELPDTEKYIQPRLLCLIRREPKEMEEALAIIWRSSGDMNQHIKFLLYFMSIDQLFMDALSTYDTDLALMVANASNKDPKEYLALLDNFNEISDLHWRHYKIDMHVKRYERAFHDLLLCYTEGDGSHSADSLEEAIYELVVSTRLYKPALRKIPQFRPSDSRDLSLIEHTIWSQYGNYLLEKRYHLEAGLAYAKAITFYTKSQELFDKALRCFSLIEDWERSFLLIQRAEGLSLEVKSNLLSRLSDQLMNRGKLLEALIVRGPISGGAEVARQLIEKGSWYLAAAAATAAHSTGSEDEDMSSLRTEISDSIRKHLEDSCRAWDSELATARSQFERLKELITTYQSNRASGGLDIDNCYTSDSLSTIDGSDASSVHSDSNASKKKGKVARSGAPSIKTKASSSTSKSSSSQSVKAKRINLKHGSRNEDLAIILELKKFIAKQNSNQDLARHMLAAHFQFSPITQFDMFTKSIASILGDCHEFAREILSKLWPLGDPSEQTYSLYKRFGNLLSNQQQQQQQQQAPLENVDFEVLVRPEMPKTLALLEL